MKFIKKETGWQNLETGKFYEFGEIAIYYANIFYIKERELISDYNTILEAVKEGKTEYKNTLKEIEEKFNDPKLNAMSTFTNTIISYIFAKEDIDSETKVFNPIQNTHFSIDKQKNNYDYRRNLIVKQGWNNLPAYADCSSLDLYLMLQNTQHTPYSVTSHFIDNKWYYAFDVENESGLILLDVQEMRNNHFEFNFCHNCDQIYIKKNKKIKYCTACSTQYNSIASKNRRNSVRYYHKKVQNYMRNSGKYADTDINNFTNESNYYFDMIKGKKDLGQNEKYKVSIKSEEEYKIWLDKILQECKKKVIITNAPIFDFLGF